MDQHIRSAARAIARARKLVVFTGAGVSKESGIATFREPETGLWARYDPMELATCEAYVRRPEFVWSWYEHRFGATASISAPAPATSSSSTAACSASSACAGSTPASCSMTSPARTRSRRAARSAVICCVPMWCGSARRSLATPIDRAQALSAACDVMLVVGTSGVVYPAAAMPLLAAEAGATVIDVNPERDALAARADIFLQGPGGDVLPRLVELVKELRV